MVDMKDIEVKVWKFIVEYKIETEEAIIYKNYCRAFDGRYSSQQIKCAMKALLDDEDRGTNRRVVRIIAIPAEIENKPICVKFVNTDTDTYYSCLQPTFITIGRDNIVKNRPRFATVQYKMVAMSRDKTSIYLKLSGKGAFPDLVEVDLKTMMTDKGLQFYSRQDAQQICHDLNRALALGLGD